MKRLGPRYYDMTSGVSMLYASLMVIGIACIILGCGALSIDWLRSIF